MAEASSPLALLLPPPSAPPAKSASPDIEAADFAFQAVASSPHSLKQELPPPHDENHDHFHANDAHRRESRESHILFSSPPAPPLKSNDETYNYNFSGAVYDESSTSASNTDPEHEADALCTTDEEAAGFDNGSRLRGGGDVSSRSSISSLPASVMVERKGEGYDGELLSDILDGVVQDGDVDGDTPVKDSRVIHQHRSGSLGYKIKAPRSGSAHSSGTEMLHPRSSPKVSRSGGLTIEYSPAFRNPSSVRAMQMRDESVFNDDGDDEVDGLSRRSISHMQHRRRGSRMSVFSHRSSGSTQTSPTKKGRSGGSPLKNSRTEFPLVLLHCTMLPPSLGSLVVQGQLDDDALLKEVLPEVYWRRWRTLREKVIDNVEVKTRGVLIPHPREDYDSLEERLLESLELEKPRIREAHYLRKEGDESYEAEIHPDLEQEENCMITSKVQCPDCGGKVSTGVEQEKKYEVKVYAANGLMRSGAWGAAWQEMEKVDVEVGVWMPEGARRELEVRLADLGLNGDHDEHIREHDEAFDEDERRRREVYGEEQRHDQSQEKVDGLFDDDVQNSHHGAHSGRGISQHFPFQPQAVSFQDLLLSCFRHILDDRKNLMIALLSSLVLFYAMTQPMTGASSTIESRADNVVVPDGSVSSTMEVPILTVTATSIAVSISTTTISESCATEARVFEGEESRGYEAALMSSSTAVEQPPQSETDAFSDLNEMVNDVTARGNN